MLRFAYLAVENYFTKVFNKLYFSNQAFLNTTEVNVVHKYNYKYKSYKKYKIYNKIENILKIRNKLEEKFDQEQFLQFEQKGFKKSNLYKIRINFIEKNKANYCNFTFQISKVSF